MTVLLVAVGGAAGACLRFLADQWVRARRGPVFPWATLGVNLTGSLLLGFLTGMTLDAPALRAFAGTGFCGALTTYSTFSYDTYRLFTGEARLLAVVNVAVTILAGLACGAIGLALSVVLER